MGGPTPNRGTLRDKFELEKFCSKVVKNVPEKKTMETDEIVKHMKHLPGYLEKGKPIQDGALGFGVMDWSRLEKWQSRHHKPSFVTSNKYSPSSTCRHHKPSFVTSNKYSPSSTCSSSLFSADESSPRSSRDQSCSPARQHFRRLTLQSHFNLASPKQDFTPHIQSCTKDVKSIQSCLKGKLKIQDESVNDNNNPNSCTRNKTPERKISTMSYNSSDIKPRSISPLRRFLKSATERSGSPVSQNSNKDGNRARSSPLRRLLDPIFPSKETCHEDARTKAKVKLDFQKEIRVVGDVSSSSLSTTRKQAVFQTTVKNDRLLFTFAVENNMEILAATVTGLTSSVKDKNKNLLYTFFTVHEVKRKNISWLSQGNKSKDHSYVPNVTAQMKVSNSHLNTREFVLFSVNPNVQPQEELEAIVVKYLRNTEGFETTVVLPGGSHGVPSKGVPSPLVDRWRSGGSCDCGGWDVGCRLRTLGGSRSDKGHLTSCQFNLFFQEEVENKRPIFSLSPLKEGIFSIEYNSSLSPLQAFSICISYAESRKLTRHTELRRHTRGAAPLVYTPIPRIKRDTRMVT